MITVWAMGVERSKTSMVENVQISVLEIEKQINKLKIGKASGPDTIKPELYKNLIKCESLIFILTKLMNDVMNSGIIPYEWKQSITKLIPKNKKPKFEDFRPIALTDISYKILMGVIKEKIEKHLTDHKLMKDEQAGATRRRRVTENIFILNYCIEKSYNLKKELFVLGIDFKKAYDSINRYEMLKVLQEYKIHPKLINLIANIYSCDSTRLYLENQFLAEIEISSGIRQGCNLSGLLFIMVTYKIIEKIDELKLGFSNDNLKIGSLFYMDDALLMANSPKEAYTIINKIGFISSKYGLELNKGKCQIMIYNKKSDINYLCENREDGRKIFEGIELVDKLKYSGVLIDDKRGLFKSQKERIFNEAIKFRNQLFSVLGNCCNRLLFGKTYWKGLILPNLLYGNDVITFNKNELERLQKHDNAAYRIMLQLPIYTARSFLRGEVGASSAIARDMKSKIAFLIHVKNNGNEILKHIIEEELVTPKMKWTKKVREYLNILDMNSNQITGISPEELKTIINEFDTKEWKAEMEERVTLQYYKSGKIMIKEEKWFKNGLRYNTMMKARSNTLQLRWRERNNEDKICLLCRKEEETLEHFLLNCKELQKYRDQCILLQLPRNNQAEDKLINKMILLEEDEVHNKNIFITILSKMYNVRNQIVKNLK